MSKAVGIELNESRIRIATISSSGKKIRIVQFHEESIPLDPGRGWDEVAGEVLKNALAKSKIPKGRCVVSIDSGDAILRDVSLPFRDDDKIRKTIHAELESLIHNHTIEELVVDYFKTGETDKGSVLLAAAVPKEIVDRRLRLLQKAGIDPVAIDLDISAIFNTLLHTGAISNDEPLLIVYGTPKYTKIVFVENRRPMSIRTIRFSLPSPETLAKEREERQKAAQWETKEVEGPVPIVVLEDHEHAHFADLDFETQSSLVEILAKEISRFMMANAAAATPSQILLTGEFEHEEAAQLLEAATEIPVATHNLLQAVGHPFSRPEPELSSKLGVPLGLGLKGCGVDALELDFRKEGFSYRKKFEGVKTTAFVTLELVIVFLAAIALYFYFKKGDIETALYDRNGVLDRQNEILKAVTGEAASDPKQAYPKLKKLMGQFGGSGGGTPLDASALDLWRAVAEATKRFHDKNRRRAVGGADLYLLLEDIDIRQSIRGGKTITTVVLSAVAANGDQMEGYRRELAEQKPFQSIRISGEPKGTKEGRKSFKLLYTNEKR